jgi:Uma2 family endonuclease
MYYIPVFLLKADAMMHYIINTEAFGEMTEEQFFQFCQSNKSLNIERNRQGQIIIMPPAGSETGAINFNLALELGLWNQSYQLGICFDSSTGFTLPNKAVRSADVAWIQRERWQQVSPEDRARFAHICPDFVVELMSKTDDPDELQNKMREWMENGCRLGWLIEPAGEQVYVYRPTAEPVLISGFAQSVSGEDVLPGFTLALNKLKL